jgi:hypothetical protein
MVYGPPQRGAAFDKNGDLRFTAHYPESIARELGQG